MNGLILGWLKVLYAKLDTAPSCVAKQPCQTLRCLQNSEWLVSNELLCSLRFWFTDFFFYPIGCFSGKLKLELAHMVVLKHCRLWAVSLAGPLVLCRYLNFKSVNTVELTAGPGGGLHHMQQSWMLAQAFPLSQALSPFSYYLLQYSYSSVPCPLLPLHFHSLFFISCPSLLLFLPIISSLSSLHVIQSYTPAHCFSGGNCKSQRDLY